MTTTYLMPSAALFSRTRDWADLEAMASAGTLEIEAAAAAVTAAVGSDDPRVERLRALGG